MAQPNIHSTITKGLVITVGGREIDWDCIKKQENNQGLSSYIYQNKRLDTCLLIEEKPNDQFQMTPLKKTHKASLMIEFNISITKKTQQLTPTIESDAIKNDAADKVMGLLLTPEKFDADEKITPELLDKAGTALANRFYFAITDNGSMLGISDFNAIITPAQYWEEHRSCLNKPSPIQQLLPNDAFDKKDIGMWDFKGGPTTGMNLAQELLKRGFIWDKNFQSIIDNGMTSTLSDIKKPKKASNNNTKKSPSTKIQKTPKAS